MEILDDENIKSQSDFILYATFGNRLAAQIIDLLVMILPIGGMIYGYIDKNRIILILCNILLALYKPLMEGIYSATIGKMVVGIKMVNNTKEDLNLIQSFTKNGFYLINNMISIASIFWIFNYTPFLEAEGILEGLEASEASPYEMASNVWSIIILISILMMLSSDKKQTLHDRIAKTFCIKK